MPRHNGQVPISSTNNRAARHAHARARQEFKTYDTSAIQPKKSKVPIVIAIIALVVIVVSASIIVAFAMGCFEQDDATLEPTQEAIIVVPEGATAQEVTTMLHEEKLIGSEAKFMDLVNSENAAGVIIPGSYLFKGGTSMEEILNALVTGPSSTGFSLAVPEGATREQIAGDVESVTEGRVTAQQFLDATAYASTYVTEYDFLASAGDNSLEGFLFPRTYTVTVTDDADAIVHMMLNQFRDEVMPLDMTYPTSKKLDLYDVVNLASIVQKEGTPEYFADIASVFYNRLNSKSPYLQSDATTAYEVQHDPTPEEVHADTPYSTYTHKGLPPTPISNPSLEAIEAVCNPASTDYMFFYTHDDGTIDFSKTYDEHMATFS